MPDYIEFINCSQFTAPQIFKKRKEVRKWQVELAQKLTEKKKDQAKALGLSERAYLYLRRKMQRERNNGTNT